jgi:hypothetical protein
MHRPMMDAAERHSEFIAEQKAELRTPAVSRDHGEADRARAVLLTLSGSTTENSAAV